MRAIIYDAGALIAAERGLRRMWAIHSRVVARGTEPIVPAPVLTEVWRGGAKQHDLVRLLAGCTIEPLTEARAYAAGKLLARADHGAVDASVVEAVLRHKAPCISGNRAHLEALAGRRRLDIIDI